MPEITSINVTNDSKIILKTNSGDIAFPELQKLGLSPNAPNWHSYEQPVITKIGSTKDTTIDNVYMALKHFPAPNISNDAVKNRDI